MTTANSNRREPVTSTKPIRRVLYVEGNIDATIGGSYYSLLFLSSGLDRTRYEPLVVFASTNELVAEFRSRGVRTMVRPLLSPISIAGPVGRPISKILNFVRGWIIEPVRLAGLIRREHVALVHLNNSIIKNHAWMIAALVARVPCITHERGINPRFKRRAVLLARSLKAIICISAAVSENFDSLGLGNLPLVTIHNGLDPREMTVTRPVGEIRAELGIGDSQRIVGIVGNIKRWKGQELVVRAMKRVLSGNPDVVCLLIGDTSRDDLSFRAHLESLIDELGLRSHVIITGYRKDVANYINALDIQIHASIDPEPFGRVLLEGMALGKPMVASGGGAVPEIVVNGGTGLLFEAGNSEALADCLSSLLANSARAARMGESARQRLARDFSIEHHVRAVQELYDRIAS